MKEGLFYSEESGVVAIIIISETFIQKLQFFKLF